MRLSEIKTIFHKELDESYPKEEVDSFFYILIKHFLGLERFVLALQPLLAISKEEEQPLFEALSDLKLQKPIQYIIGKAHFMEMDFLVDEGVLIPRPETEDMVRLILNDLGELPQKKERFKILDIGTGTGCVAIALARNLPSAKVLAMDISDRALVIAGRNAFNNGVKIEFLQADILKTPQWAHNFDVIVSNPPYVRESEKRDIKSNVKDYEPGLALFVSDEDPLVFYRAIINFSKHHLHQGGYLYLEINEYLAEETKALLDERNFTDIELRKDIFGKDRILKCRLK
ncbi:MAG: peptide chain release factor N(5)-glutamine methyltransferase [Flavobacteriales bacterium]|nr:MAG: peptide chain release factor N(5)-glutamine methyltransferase [Flavobacteriales bacterium]